MDKKLKNHIMFVGTGSDVGKSVIAAGFCRIFLQDGYTPAPYKSQNMSLNSYVTKQGGEIGRAQAVQAEACRLECHTDMNPILLKPSSDKKSQVILNGKVYGNYNAGDYYRKELKEELLAHALKAFRRLEQKHSPIVIEGAGSISELNLHSTDIANMRIACETNASTILIADIERGGVFGSVYGSIELLSPKERACIKGILINKFRGDINLFTEGRKILEKLTGVPVLGVIPYFDIVIEEEDSVSLKAKPSHHLVHKVNIAVVRLSRMSNFTDFARLEQIEQVNLFFTNNSRELAKADIIIVPGSKNTIADMQEIRQIGIDKTIIEQAKIGKTVIGICGGYQMMGESIIDPHGVESSLESLSGLGLLPVNTTLQKEKHTVQSDFYFKNETELCQGYEIHMGKTERKESAKSLNKLPNNSAEGCMVSQNCWGSYMHGILDNQAVINDLLSPFVDTNQIEQDYDEFKNEQYDLLADHLRGCVDIDRVYKILSE